MMIEILIWEVKLLWKEYECVNSSFCLLLDELECVVWGELLLICICFVVCKSVVMVVFF